MTNGSGPHHGQGNRKKAPARKGAGKAKKGRTAADLDKARLARAAKGPPPAPGA